MKESIKLLLNKEESPVLEFKREWYWNDQTPAGEMTDKWGELVKDLISLANGYISHVGTDRYLIFGFSESDRELYSVEFNNIKQFNNISQFRKKLIQRMEEYTKPSFININIEIILFDNKELLVFEIPSPTQLTELKKQLKTKSRHLDEGTVLIRKGQDSDEVRAASPSEIESLKVEFSSYSASNLFKRMNPVNELVIPERSIEKTVQLFIDKNSSFSLADNYPVKERNWKDNIIYEVYRLVDGFSGIREFVYIHDSSNQGKTVGEIKAKNLISNFESSIILIDRPRIKDVDRRKANIKRLFKSDYVFLLMSLGMSIFTKTAYFPTRNSICQYMLMVYMMRLKKLICQQLKG